MEATAVQIFFSLKGSGQGIFSAAILTNTIETDPKLWDSIKTRG